jgi:putative membrane protein insertion efficiency factor
MISARDDQTCEVRLGCGKIRLSMKFLVLDLLGIYKAMVSPFLPPACRFEPTCSEYTRQAVEKYGAVRGTWMGVKRILRCQPFCKGGHDPVR